MRIKLTLLLTLVLLTYSSEIELPSIAQAPKHPLRTHPPCKSAEEALSEFNAAARLPVALDQVVIVGQVRSPGTRTFVKPASLMQLIAEAGGLDLKGASRIYIFRQVPGRDERKSIFVDLKAIERGREQDVVLEGGDIVYAPEGCVPALSWPQGDAVRTISPSVAGATAITATRLTSRSS